MSELSGEGWTSNGKPIEVPWRWQVWIERLDGSYDEYRDCHFGVTPEDAQWYALDWQARHSLPIVTVTLDGARSPFPPRATLQ